MKKNILVIILLLISIITISSVSGALSNTEAIEIKMMNQDPDPVSAGDIVEVRLGIDNLGGEQINNVILEIIPEYPFTLISGEKAIQTIKTVGTRQGGDNMQIIKYQLRTDKDVKAGTEYLRIKETHDESYKTIEKLLPIEVTSKENAEIIQIDKTVLIPGKQTSLKFVINNVGSSPLRDLSFYWEDANKIVLPVGSDNTRYIKYIDIDQSKEVEYQVIADTNAISGLYQLNLHLTYYNPINASTKEISTIAGIYVGGETDFDVSFSESSNGDTSFSVANIGSNSASSVSVMIPTQDGWSVTGSNSAIIGNLNKGDYTVASFKLKSASNNKSQNKLTIQIAYTDTMGERKLVDKILTLEPKSITSVISLTNTTQQSFFSKYKWYIIAIFVIIGYFVFKSYKRRKKENPNLKFRNFFKAKN